MPFATPSRQVRCSRPSARRERPEQELRRAAAAASIQSGRSRTRPHSASAASASPFQDATALSSRAGFGRCSRSSKSSRARLARRARRGGRSGRPRTDASSSSGAPSRARPGERQALDAVGVGVLRRGEAAALERELAQHVLDRLLDDLAVALLAEHEPAVQVGDGELRVVVEHLLEVRHEPALVDRVAVEAAADEVVHPAGRHPVERPLGHLALASARAGTRAPARPGTSARRPSRPTPSRSPCVRPSSAVRGSAGSASSSRGSGRASPQRRCSVSELGRLVELRRACRATPRRPSTRMSRKLRQPVPRLRRQVGAAEERLALRRQEDGQRPAAAAGQRDDRVHVDRVDVGPLLAVDLDADEVLVHQRAPSRGSSNDSRSITWHQWQAE